MRGVGVEVETDPQILLNDLMTSRFACWAEYFVASSNRP
jgi:hypothetical protein